MRFYADLPLHEKIPLPALSPTMEEGNLVSWAVKEGDEIEEGDPLCDIETDKAVMTFDSPFVGIMAKILVPAGTKNIKIGEIICIIVEKKEDVAAFKDFKVVAAAESVRYFSVVYLPSQDKILSFSNRFKLSSSGHIELFCKSQLARGPEVAHCLANICLHF